MKVRLYRGPHADKVLFVNDHESIIEFAEAVPSSFVNSKMSNPVAIGLKKTIYQRTQHTHPDGSVYFEWDKPKGTKTGRKPKRKKTTQWQNVGYTMPTGTITTGQVFVTNPGPYTIATP